MAGLLRARSCNVISSRESTGRSSRSVAYRTCEDARLVQVESSPGDAVQRSRRRAWFRVSSLREALAREDAQPAVDVFQDWDSAGAPALAKCVIDDAPMTSPGEGPDPDHELAPDPRARPVPASCAPTPPAGLSSSGWRTARKGRLADRLGGARPAARPRPSQGVVPALPFRTCGDGVVAEPRLEAAVQTGPGTASVTQLPSRGRERCRRPAPCRPCVTEPEPSARQRSLHHGR